MDICNYDSISQCLDSSGSWILPWPLMTFGLDYPKQAFLGHPYQSIIVLMAEGFHRNISLKKLLTGPNQYQTPLKLT